MAENKDNSVLTEDDDEDQKVEYVATETPPTQEAAEEHDDDDEETHGKEAAEEDDDDEREEIRARRREEKKERKERRETAIKRDKLELEFLRKRNDDLERRISSVEQRTTQTAMGDLDAQLQAAVQEAEAAERIIAKAVEAGNGEDVAKAMRYRDQAISKAQQLHYAKQQALHAQQQQSQKQPDIDGEVIHHAQEFMEENPWYDPQGRDEDSAIVQTIDARLMQEGYDPRSADYWEELRSRISKRLPDKNKPVTQKRKPQGGPMVGSGKEHAPTSTRREIYISPERKAALIEAGVWDDPVLRARYIKRYAEYDRQNNNA
jgi:hypothetical protein